MFANEIKAGEELIDLLTQLAESKPAQATSRSTSQVRFTRLLDDWRVRVEQELLDTLGDDPRSRFSYLFQNFRDRLFATGHALEVADVNSLNGVVNLLRHFQRRLDPAVRSQNFDWRSPITSESPTPDLAQIEAKRWEFHEALLRTAEDHPGKQVDPLEVANSIELHEFHAREFFVFLARIGRLPRDRFLATWQALAKEVDSDNSASSTNLQTSPTICLNVFLCHASEDKEAVRELSRFVRSLGHDPWLDDEKLIPGQEWDYEIRQALKRSDIIVVCLSDKSTKRGYLQKELKRALDIADEFPTGALFLIPVRLTECTVPDRLERFQYVDLFRPNGPERLSAALDVAQSKR